jgi:hypothetical protein
LSSPTATKNKAIPSNHSDAAMGEKENPKRVLRVTKWLSTTPAIAVCSSCSREFKVPMSALTKTKDAQTNLQQQFDMHECKH